MFIFVLKCTKKFIIIVYNKPMKFLNFFFKAYLKDFKKINTSKISFDKQPNKLNIVFLTFKLLILGKIDLFLLYVLRSISILVIFLFEYKKLPKAILSRINIVSFKKILSNLIFLLVFSILLKKIGISLFIYFFINIFIKITYLSIKDYSYFFYKAESKPFLYYFGRNLAKQSTDFLSEVMLKREKTIKIANKVVGLLTFKINKKNGTV